jgi:hypothetical protein
MTFLRGTWDVESLAFLTNIYAAKPVKNFIDFYL